MGKKGGKRKVMVALEDSEEEEEKPQLSAPQKPQTPSNSVKPNMGLAKAKISAIVESDSDEEDKISSFKIRKSKQSRKIEKKKRDAKFLGYSAFFNCVSSKINNFLG